MASEKVPEVVGIGNNSLMELYAADATDKTGMDEYLEGRNPFPKDGKCLLYGAESRNG